MNKKKNIIGLILIVVLSVGVTITYLQSTDTFENILESGAYKTTTYEEFTSPDNWKPGDTTPKTIITTNEGTIPVLVRVKFEESWKSANDNDLPLVNNNETMAIINLDNEEDWVKKGNYYYYISEVAPGESTSSLIKSVTFNPNYQGNITCTTVNNTNSCISSSDGYMGGTYTLNIIMETIQADAINEVWGLDELPSNQPTTTRIIYDISDNNEYATYLETNKSIFLRKTFQDEILRLQEVGFILNNNVHYLKGEGASYDEENQRYNNDSVYYEENKTTLLNVFGSENCLETSNGIDCDDNTLINVKKYGYIFVYAGTYGCAIEPDGTSSCYEN